jgi:outer membrane protein W
MIFVLGVSLLGSAPAVYAEGEDIPETPKYFVMKGGRYSPRVEYAINDFNAGTTSHLDTKNGVNGELALGQYADPELALELGIGYFESRGAPAGETGSTRLKAIPIVITAKGFVPLGALQPYLEAGIGIYYTTLEVSGNTGGFSSQSKTTYGAHAGFGFDIDLASKLFIGLEGRYLWVKPYYGGHPVKLDGFATSINLGFRY